LNRLDAQIRGVLWFFLALAAFISGGCSTTKLPHAQNISTYVLVVSVHDQRLALLHNGFEVRKYVVSTALHGVGEVEGDATTPRGWHSVSEKIGEGARIGAVFAARELTGEVVEVNTHGRWPIVTRIFRLAGIEKENQNTQDRLIYIHGSPVEENLGKVASGGCIRMRSIDIVEIFDVLPVDSKVYISELPLNDAISLVTQVPPPNYSR
jgi:L,D-transpeptidase catalytic domain